jgi:putative tryptophan/tyrosine transport system substrate-binding protein
VFTRLAEVSPGAPPVGSDPAFYTRRDKIGALASAHGLPAIYELRDFAFAGGLVTSGDSVRDRT